MTTSTSQLNSHPSPLPKGFSPVGGGGPFDLGDGLFGSFDPVGGGGPFNLDRNQLGRLVTRPPAFRDRHGFGYLPDVPDRRDASFADMAGALSRRKAARGFDTAHLKAVKNDAETPLPERVHLGDTGNLSPVEDQGRIGSCTAHAVIGLAEYLIKRGSGETTNLSRMFLYKIARNLMGVHGDTGAFIRTTIKALAAFGTPPETQWPYAGELLDCEPMAFQYSYAANFKAMRYARIDANSAPTDQTLAHLLRALAAGFPVAFGFPVYSSIEEVTADAPLIPMPLGDKDKLLGGHAVLAVGYDRVLKVAGQNEPGALIIRNSWGESWGSGGYGFLPFGYVLEGLAVDIWTVFSSRWLVEGKFDGN